MGNQTGQQLQVSKRCRTDFFQSNQVLLHHKAPWSTREYSINIKIYGKDFSSNNKQLSNLFLIIWNILLSQLTTGSFKFHVHV